MQNEKTTDIIVHEITLLLGCGLVIGIDKSKAEGKKSGLQEDKGRDVCEEEDVCAEEEEECVGWRS